MWPVEALYFIMEGYLRYFFFKIKASFFRWILSSIWRDWPVYLRDSGRPRSIISFSVGHVVLLSHRPVGSICLCKRETVEISRMTSCLSDNNIIININYKSAIFSFGDERGGQNGLLPFLGKLISLLPFFPN